MYVVIAAAFGIGKTSFVIDIASTYAYNYLNNPNMADDYIPIFVLVKDNLNKVYYQQNFNSVLSMISKATGSHEVNIVVILDGLDEYQGDTQKIVDMIYEKRNEFSKIKLVITTRMKIDLPQKLQISKYIRLLPFDKNQVKDLLQKYGLQCTFDEITRDFGLEEWKRRRPLFCWMFSMACNKPRAYKRHLTNRSLLYQEFIHSIIIGKHLEEAKEHDFIKYYLKEKKIIRKIAALRQIYSDGLNII